MSREYWKDYYEARRLEAIEALGRKCVACGSVEDLQFDHICPETKLFSISARLRGLRHPEVQKELAKCQLLCKTCHKEKTGEESRGREPVNKGMWQHGTLTGYRYGCKCEDCWTFGTAYRRKKRAEKKAIREGDDAGNRSAC